MVTKESSLHKLSMGTLLAVLVQIIAIVWWASDVAASVENLETSDSIRNNDRKEFFERLSVVETRVITNNQILIRLETKVDSLVK
jgi:hypothetical protein